MAQTITTRKILLLLPVAVACFGNAFFFRYRQEDPVIAGVLVAGIVFTLVAQMLWKEQVLHRYARRCWNYAGLFFVLIPVTALTAVAINVTLNPPQYSGLAVLAFALVGAISAAIGLPLALISFIIAYIIKRRHAQTTPDIT